jgi:hypothetical protein
MTISGQVSNEMLRNNTNRKAFILEDVSSLDNRSERDTYSSSANLYPIQARPPYKNVNILEYNVGMALRSGGCSHRSGLYIALRKSKASSK